ncbi:hypothetical protein [Bradyrhizobium sp. 174]|uniref:hypothetical protein n=1 Tax=Bradyrhizobium sp. 174 TaxID=2782645 RepID=UPI001FFA4103|nr:hypothetical protein [Bradyrhizobium sp. 174]MCK1570786.1 hypothetical protein [Bradyrhizobium sp. 174]
MASIKSIREKANIKHAADKSRMTIVIDAYHTTRLIQVDGRVISGTDNWLDMAEVVVETLNEFRRQVEKQRQKIRSKAIPSFNRIPNGLRKLSTRE